MTTPSERQSRDRAGFFLLAAVCCLGLGPSACDDDAGRSRSGASADAGDVAGDVSDMRDVGDVGDAGDADLADAAETADSEAPIDALEESDGLADSPIERYEIPLAAGAGANQIVVRATDLLQNVVSKAIESR
jgi:hypothetical protein